MSQKVKQKVKQTKKEPCRSEDREVILASKTGTPGATRTRNTRFSSAYDAHFTLLYMRY